MDYNDHFCMASLANELLCGDGWDGIHAKIKGLGYPDEVTFLLFLRIHEVLEKENLLDGLIENMIDGLYDPEDVIELLDPQGQNLIIPNVGMDQLTNYQYQ
jgi:hypothetical protein